MLSLSVHHDGRTRRVPFDRPRLRLGSAPDNDVVLDSTFVSRHHAVLTLQGDLVGVQDLGSRNGTFLGDTAVRYEARPVPLEIRLGSDVRVSVEATASEDVLLAPGILPAGSPMSLADPRMGTDPDPAPSAAQALAASLLVALAQGADASELLRLAMEAAGSDAACLLVRSSRGVEPVVLALHGPRSWLGGDVGARLRTMPLDAIGTLSVELVPHRIEVATAPGLAVALRNPSRSLDMLAVTSALQIAVRPAQELPRPTRPAPRELVLTAPDRSAVQCTSPLLRELHARMAGAVTSDLPVLLTGETGVGKEIYAWSIHGQSARAGGPMQVVNASAIPESLLEAILFGAAEGAATGVRQQPGLIRQADGGTFFFDEIGEMSPALQSKLLRVLDDGHVLPVGGTQRVRVDVRFIAATNRDLRAEVGQGRFREDLFHRLRGHEFTIPPLRDHPEDVPLYVNAFLQEECTRAGRFVAGVTMHAMELLLACPWPGNVRELEMTLRRIVNELRDDRPITHEDLPEEIRRQARDSNRDDGLEARVDAMRRRHVVEALAASGGNRSDAARRLGLSRNGLRALITRLGIE